MAFPWVETSTGPGGFMICAYHMTGTPEGSTESGSMSVRICLTCRTECTYMYCLVYLSAAFSRVLRK